MKKKAPAWVVAALKRRAQPRLEEEAHARFLANPPHVMRIAVTHGKDLVYSIPPHLMPKRRKGRRRR